MDFYRRTWVARNFQKRKAEGGMAEHSWRSVQGDLG